ncbi:DivIVA domain-containing protein [Actinoplanes oblitus]|uniref:Cell wall synthesis protein Wag31 n=1 Tax=Actinoplanes oblitus TaxID=3040509 RepID=A0ABY8WPG3_9ACTN|nr:DivIVA domain-containing protein [Actinoplanes oblitus]WIM99317.1 DivIVA domain-containing protein [Actinoplanes oblitus]
MPLTPAEIGTVAFRRPPAGTQGYHQDEVDAFLADVAGEMRRLERENRALSEQLTPHDLAERVRRLQLEYLDVQEHIAMLEGELERWRRPVDTRMLELAQRTADEHLAEARQQAGTVLDQATTKAAQLISEAQLRASTIVADARHAHAEAVAGLEAKRAAALDEINELRAEVERLRAALAADMRERLAEFTG